MNNFSDDLSIKLSKNIKYVSVMHHEKAFYYADPRGLCNKNKLSNSNGLNLLVGEASRPLTEYHRFYVGKTAPY